MSAAVALAALLSLFRTPVRVARYIDGRRAAIVAAAEDAGRAHDVPPSVLLTVAFLETRIGSTYLGRRPSNWGAPASRAHRDRNGNARDSASALAWGRRRCGSWTAALSHYRCGLCRPCPRLVGYTDRYAAHVITQVHARAGVPLPADFHRSHR